jgi:hypothetical protein
MACRVAFVCKFSPNMRMAHVQDDAASGGARTPRSAPRTPKVTKAPRFYPVHEKSENDNKKGNRRRSSQYVP